MKRDMDNRDNTRELGSEILKDLEADTNTVLDMRNTWHNKNPMTWVSSDILNWIYFNAGLNGIPLESLKGEKFQRLTGRELCGMTSEEFKARDPDYGEFLHFTLKVQLDSAESKWNKACTPSTEFDLLPKQKSQQKQQVFFQGSSFQTSTSKFYEKNTKRPHMSDSFQQNQQIQQPTTQQKQSQQILHLLQQHLQQQPQQHKIPIMCLKQQPDLATTENNNIRSSDTKKIHSPPVFSLPHNNFSQNSALISKINSILQINQAQKQQPQQPLPHPQQQPQQPHLQQQPQQPPQSQPQSQHQPHQFFSQQLLPQQKLQQLQHLCTQENAKPTFNNQANFQSFTDPLSFNNIRLQFNNTTDLLHHRLLLPSTINININNNTSNSSNIKSNDNDNSKPNAKTINRNNDHRETTIPLHQNTFQRCHSKAREDDSMEITITKGNTSLIPTFVQNLTDDDDDDDDNEGIGSSTRINSGNSFCGQNNKRHVNAKHKVPRVVDSFNDNIDNNDNNNKQSGNTCNVTNYDDDITDHNNNKISNSDKKDFYNVNIKTTNSNTTNSNNNKNSTNHKTSYKIQNISNNGLSYYKMKKLKLQYGQNHFNHDNHMKSPKKRTSKILLSDFMRDLLNDPLYNPSCVCWEDKENGVFRIVSGKSRDVASLWGKRKNNPKMNFEKMGRSLRWCRANNGNFSEVPKNDKLPKKLIFRLST